jgi:hypothetical protein
VKAPLEAAAGGSSKAAPLAVAPVEAVAPAQAAAAGGGSAAAGSRQPLASTASGHALLDCTRHRVTVGQALAALRSGLVSVPPTDDGSSVASADAAEPQPPQLEDGQSKGHRKSLRERLGGLLGRRHQQQPQLTMRTTHSMIDRGEVAEALAALGAEASVHFEMDEQHQLTLVQPAGSTDGLIDAVPPAAGENLASPLRSKVIGLLLPPGGGWQPSEEGSCVVLQTEHGGYPMELASAKDYAGLVLGLNAALLHAELLGETNEQLDERMWVGDMLWAASVQGVVS